MRPDPRTESVHLPVAAARPLESSDSWRSSPRGLRAALAATALLAAFGVGFTTRSLVPSPAAKLSATPEIAVERVARIAAAPPRHETTAEREVDVRQNNAVAETNAATAALNLASLRKMTNREWIPESAPPASPAEIALTNAATRALMLDAIDDLDDPGRPFMTSTMRMKLYEAP